MTYVRGDHTFRFGTELLQQRSKQFAPFRGRGELSFGNSASSVGRRLAGFANFIDNFGGAGSALRDFGSPAYYPEMFRQSYFFQDRWRASEALTLTLGLRYENFGQPVNSVNTAAFTGLFNVDPVTRLGPYALPNDAETDNNNFAPTLGFAYSPSFEGGIGGFLFGQRRTVVRGWLSDHLRLVLQQHRVKRCVFVSEHHWHHHHLGCHDGSAARAGEPHCELPDGAAPAVTT